MPYLKISFLMRMSRVHVQLSELSGTSLGYGFSRIVTKPSVLAAEVQTKHKGEDGVTEWRPEGGALAIS